MEFGNSAVRQVFQRLLVLVQIGTHFRKGVNQPQRGPGLQILMRILADVFTMKTAFFRALRRFL